MDKQKIKKYCIIAIITALLVIIEQCIKIIVINKQSDFYLIQNILKITYVKNTGGAFGVGQNNTATFIITNIIVLGIIIRFIVTQLERIDKKNLFALILVLAGGVSNLFDRIYRGFVIDYIDVNSIIEFPVFNLADIYVVCGWVIFVICIMLTTIKEVKAKKVEVSYGKKNSKNIRSRD